MALTEFEYSKSWRDPEDFPSYEENEEKVRDDMQLLFDEIRDGLNRLIAALTAENLGFSATPEIDAATVQNAIELVQAQIRDMAAGQMPNGSVDTVKLAELAVTAAKLANLAVTTEKLADRAVTEEKLAPGCVGTEKLADRAVTAEKLAAGAVSAEKLDPAALALKADLEGGKVKAEQLSRRRVNVSSSRTLTLSDAGKALFCLGGHTLSIPTNAEVAFPIGTEILIFRAGSSAVSVREEEGVTLLCPVNPPVIGSRWGFALLKKWDANTWSLSGEGLAPSGYLANFAEGFAPRGQIRLTRGVHYFDSEAQLPPAGVAGRIFLVAAE